MKNEVGALSNLELLLIANDEARRLELKSVSVIDYDSRALLHRSVDAQSAFGLFGLLLGTFTPAAIYSRLLLSEPGITEIPALPLLFAISILLSALVGRWFAARLLFSFDRYRYGGFARSVATGVPLGILWGLVTGGLGGLVVYGFGGILGAMIASVTAAVTFPLFALLYYALSRGDMIESRQLWPIAVGIPAVIAALILGL